MRKDVVVLAVAMVACAGVLLWSGTRTDDAGIASTAPAPAVPAPRPTPTASGLIAPDRTGVPAVVPRPHAPLNRYRSGDDLWATWQTLRRSTDGGESWVAETIVRGCFFTTRATAIASQILAGKDLVVFDEMTPEETAAFEAGTGPPRTHRQKATDDQVAAARVLVARCERFAAMTPVEYRSAVDDVASRRRQADDPVAIAEAMQAHRLAFTDERLRFVLDSGDPAAIDFVIDELADRFRKRARPVSTDDESTADRQALRLMECDLGNDCDADSEPALLDCLQRAELCRLDVSAQVMATATPAMRRSIESQRRTMLDAIRSGDYAIWGL